MGDGSRPLSTLERAAVNLVRAERTLREIVKLVLAQPGSNLGVNPLVARGHGDVDQARARLVAEVERRRR